MKTTKPIKITKKIRETVKIDQALMTEISEYLDLWYPEYLVNVEDTKGYDKNFDDLMEAFHYAGDNSDYLKHIIITAHSKEKNFRLEFVNPDKRMGATVIFEGTSKDTLDKEKMKEFYKAIQYKFSAFTSISILIVYLVAYISLKVSSGTYDSKLLSLIMTIVIPFVLPILLWWIAAKIARGRNRLQIWNNEENINNFKKEIRRKEIIEYIPAALIVVGIIAAWFIW